MSPTEQVTRRGSRDRVLDLLRDAARPLSVAELTDAAALSANAVRFHLQRLIADGLVRSGADPDHTGPGRPALRYAVTGRDATDPASSYRLLAALLGRALTRTSTPGAAADAGRDWARALAPRREAASSEPAIDVVRRLFDASGFDPHPAGDGRTLELHRCPFLDLAVEQPEIVCAMHRGLVEGLLKQIGARHDVRLVAVLDGSGPCLVHLDPRAAGPHTGDPGPEELHP